MMSGSRKSPMTPRAMSACTAAKACGWRSDTCDPRRSGSRGVASGRSTPSASSASMKVPVTESEAARTSAGERPSYALSAASRASTESSGGGAGRGRSMSGAGPWGAPLSSGGEAVVCAQRGLEGEHREQRRGADAGALDARRWLVVAAHLERAGVAVPARQRLVEVALVARCDVDERWGAGSAVEVLVAAADGEVGAPRVEVDLEDARGVAEIPAGQGAHGVGCIGDRAQVPELARAVVDARVGGEREAVADLGDGRDGVPRVDPPHLEAGGGG